MNERLLFLLVLLLIVPGRAATLAQVPAPPVTQTSPGVPAGLPPQGSATGPRDNEQKPETGTGRIAGRVIGGENGAPLRRAVVSLSAEGMREGRSATTDDAGRFEFKDLPAARFDLNASKAGYVTMRYGRAARAASGKPNVGLRNIGGRRVPSAKWPTLDFSIRTRAENKRFRAGTLRLANRTFPRADGLAYDIGCGQCTLLHLLMIHEFTLQALSLGLQEFSHFLELRY